MGDERPRMRLVPVIGAATPAVCDYCSRAATRLCDFPDNANAESGRCDAKLCARCSTVRSDRDYCRQHAPFVAEG